MLKLSYVKVIMVYDNGIKTKGDKMTILEKMNNKLKTMEEKKSSMINAHFAEIVPHGGTPFITDNSKGRQAKNRFDKSNDAIRNLSKQIEEQKEKINKMENKIAYRATQTKQSVKFIKKNEISPILLKLQEDGKVKQWAKNPQLFFVIGLEKVALMTLGGKVGINKKYSAKTKEDFDYCKKLILKETHES